MSVAPEREFNNPFPQRICCKNEFHGCFLCIPFNDIVFLDGPE